MIKLPLANTEDSKKSVEILKRYYQNDLICGEKKPWLTRLMQSRGPFLAVESVDPEREEAYIMDAASQIATLGLGFSPLSFMGTGHFQESWSNRTDTPEARALRKALELFLQRMTGWDHLTMLLCNSGAEANERALGLCYARRNSDRADKILAFKGSFHGRTLVSVASTWSAAKREPFQWPEAKSVFCSWPTVLGGEIDFPIPPNWHEVWEDAPAKEFTPPDARGDALLTDEIASLQEVREQLLSGEVFAIILEPMQSEGGDRYGSNRFHLGLMLMAKAFGVPLIYDEVQTGFYLGREFFWYRQFHLRDREGNELVPDFVVCSKKAQLGMVLSPHQLKLSRFEDGEEFSMASLSRGLIHGMVMDQYREGILSMEKMAHEGLAHLAGHYEQFIANPRARGLCFAFDIHPSVNNEQAKSWVGEFVKRRFERGLLYYPAGERTLRFRLNLSFIQQDVNFLFEQLDCLCRTVFLSEEVPLPTTVTTRGRSVDVDYRRNITLLKKKLSVLKGESTGGAWEMLQQEAHEMWGAELFRFDEKNFLIYRDEIMALQRALYEPIRQTSIELFEQAAGHKGSLCLGLKQGDVLGGILFSAPPSLYPKETGVGDDPLVRDGNTLYTLDTTVQKDFHGVGMGQFLKYAQVLLACEQGLEVLCGKNRVGMARSMIKLNLSLGSYEREYLSNNYRDGERNGDSFYYHCPVRWKPSPLNLSCRIASPCEELDGDFIQEQLPSLANKVCLSNFVSERFLKILRDLATLLPSSLQHIYSASGQSECVDKVGKSLWYSGKKKAHRMMTFHNHFFGNGTFLARSLNVEGEGYFPVDILPEPKDDNYQTVLESVRSNLSREDYGGVWIEPVTQRRMYPVPREFLCALRKLCQEKEVPLIYNETASAGFAYNSSHYFASSDEELTPDVGLAFLGGQAGMVFCRKGIWVETQLMMISTWDGDEFSFANYHRSMREILEDSDRYQSTLQHFEASLKSILSAYPIEAMNLQRGRGWFKGTLPVSLRCCFERRGEGYLVDPSYHQMKRFLAHYGT